MQKYDIYICEKNDYKDAFLLKLTLSEKVICGQIRNLL